jgi:hypothetical protein
LRAARASIERRGRHAVACALTLLAIAVLEASVPCAHAQSPDRGGISREYKIKAAFLYNFGRYVQWPKEAFQDPKASFVIGVVGPSPLTPDLRRIAEAKKIQERQLKIRQVSDLEQMDGCHILFFPATLAAESRTKALRHCSGSPILLVGETTAFLKEGGMVSLVIEENRVRVYIALKAAQREKLVVSSKLLQVSRVVD